MPRKRVILLWLFACESGPHCDRPSFFHGIAKFTALNIHSPRSMKANSRLLPLISPSKLKPAVRWKITTVPLACVHTLLFLRVSSLVTRRKNLFLINGAVSKEKAHRGLQLSLSVDDPTVNRPFARL